MVNSVERISLFSGLIYKTRFTGDLSHIADLALTSCKQNGADYSAETGGISTYNTIRNAISMPECTELHNFIIDQHHYVWKQWHLSNRPRQVQSSWFNWHPPGAKTEDHDHSGIHLVIVVYLKNPVNGGNIQFKDPMHQVWASYPRTEDYMYDWESVEVTTGDILFFPGFMRHRTEVNQSNEDRLVLTTNVCIDYFNSYDV